MYHHCHHMTAFSHVVVKAKSLRLSGEHFTVLIAIDPELRSWLFLLLATNRWSIWRKVAPTWSTSLCYTAETSPSKWPIKFSSVRLSVSGCIARVRNECVHSSCKRCGDVYFLSDTPITRWLAMWTTSTTTTRIRPSSTTTRTSKTDRPVLCRKYVHVDDWPFVSVLHS